MHKLLILLCTLCIASLHLQIEQNVHPTTYELLTILEQTWPRMWQKYLNSCLFKIFLTSEKMSMIQKQGYVAHMAEDFKIYARSEVGPHSDNFMFIRRVTGNFQLRMDRDMHRMQFEGHQKDKLFQCKPMCSFVHWIFHLHASHALNLTFMELYYTTTVMPCKMEDFWFLVINWSTTLNLLRKFWSKILLK